MNGSFFASITRQTGALSRRGSLRILGGAALASAIPTLGAAKDGKNSRKRRKKRVDQCQGQLEQCRSFMELFREGNEDCEELPLPCCEPLARCDATEAFTCLFQVS